MPTVGMTGPKSSQVHLRSTTRVGFPSAVVDIRCSTIPASSQEYNKYMGFCFPCSLFKKIPCQKNVPLSSQEYNKYMKNKDFKDFVDKYASDYAQYLKECPP